LNKSRSYFKLFRPSQWIKNIFVMTGGVFAGKIFEPSFLILSLQTAFIFCIASSSVYSFNDCLDFEQDKLHDLKKNRPIASGEVTRKEGFFLSLLLSIIALSLAYLFINKILFLIILIYLFINILYSLFLKKVILIDVFLIAFGFMLRVLAGTYALNIPPSHWIIICTMMISLFLGLSKRYAELISPHKNKPSLQPTLYDKTFLLLLIGVSASCTIITYGLYTIDPKTIATHGTSNLIYSLPLVIYGLFRYMFIVVSKNKGETPSKEIFTDKHLLINIIIYISLIFILL